MNLIFPSSSQVIIEHEPICLRVRWFDHIGAPPFFWLSTNRGRQGEIAVPLRATVQSMKVDMEMHELLIIYKHEVANCNH